MVVILLSKLATCMWSHVLVLHVEIEVNQVTSPLVDSRRGVVGIEQLPELLIPKNRQQFLERNKCTAELHIMFLHLTGVPANVYTFCTRTQ